MGKIIAIINQKGGVGKTTTAINLSSCLGLLDKKVLLIDIDPQSNSTRGVGLDSSLVENSIYHLMTGKVKINQSILRTKWTNLDIIPSSLDLTTSDLEIYNHKDPLYLLKNCLNLIKDKYDYVIVDCPPSLGVLNMNAMVAADSILIPVQCEYFALEGLTQLLATLRKVQKDLNSNLTIEGVVMTMFDNRATFSKEIVNLVKDYFKETVFRTVIPRNIKITEASSYGSPIVEYDKDSSGAIAYMELCKEVLACAKIK